MPPSRVKMQKCARTIKKVYSSVAVSLQIDYYGHLVAKKGVLGPNYKNSLFYTETLYTINLCADNDIFTLFSTEWGSPNIFKTIFSQF